MNEVATEAATGWKKNLWRLQALRDQLRVRLHLATTSLKDQWKKLEPRLGDVEKIAGQLSTASRAKVAEAVKKLIKLRQSLRPGQP
jgi:hypothetical protein